MTEAIATKANAPRQMDQIARFRRMYWTSDLGQAAIHAVARLCLSLERCARIVALADRSIVGIRMTVRLNTSPVTAIARTTTQNRTR
jgi:hypothetical protein